ncbi:MAG: 23S rRNA (pseudouridine(1915)-N(3))-methyltransferase RlmH [Janthinobacterium lividum]
MRLQLAYVSPRRERLKSSAAQVLIEEYVARASRYLPVKLQAFLSEDELLATTSKRAGRIAPYCILLDSSGRSRTSTGFAELLGQQQDQGTQEIVLAIGPANGWSRSAKEGATLLLSLGAMTLPHELALVVLAEQVYRALTILAGHPYHNGHE